MTHGQVAWLCFGCALWAAGVDRTVRQAAAPPAPPVSAGPRALLVPLLLELGFSDGQVGRALKGAVEARALGSRSPELVGAAAVARMRVPARAFLDRFHDIRWFKQAEEVKAVGVFGDPPGIADVAALSLDPRDLRDLRECRVGRCDLQVSAEDVGRIRAALPRCDAGEPCENVLNEEFRRLVIDRTTRYRAGGSAALPPYVDHSRPAAVEEGMNAIFAESGYLHAKLPEFFDVLRGASAPPPDGVLDEFLYWSKEQFGLKPTVSLTHALVCRFGAVTTIASRQIYANHYYQASLGIAIIVPSEAGGIYVVYVNRSVSDTARRAGPIGRMLMRSRIARGVKANMERLRSRIEKFGG